ncbi:carboxypeptidase-like regulatory domain-containing protein [Spongiivirga citrea]|uniref:Carboxypeptidase-like regulatory domain-containing protein n=1 Tax=Spongiivirga citrea TaxID=1481457 RepID=A0A6M0CET3_9FLAO|nr:carboxypeptidase-like regulatory domain-containing protein [Spongiivirga citrea]NER15932.1 carboxypeptidase-like regulatory domain-containing protein [Spongiivirga citrea]
MTTKKSIIKQLYGLSMVLCLALGINHTAFAQDPVQIAPTVAFNQYKGTVVNSSNNAPLVFASLTVNGTNISTITNSEGEFALKIPKTLTAGKITVSFLGFKTKVLDIQDLKEEKTKIKLETSVTELSEVNISVPKNARELVRKTLKNRGTNYVNDPTVMTAFYRETIKKRRTNVSLSEAVVNIYKQPYTYSRKDAVKLYKARKSTNYKKLDTVALKLQGGPFSTLYLDIMKYPEYVFTEDMLEYYTFSFGRTTSINNQPVYVVNFKQLETLNEPLYYGTLYINPENYVLTSAIYHLNLENEKLASAAFVKKKPRDVTVIPTEASYRVDYRNKNGKWHYGYGNVQLEFKVNWRKKLFNSRYKLSCEMAITDWETNTENNYLKPRERLRPTVIIGDEASGFSDPEFWGEYNVIEPEKSIEAAIKKIQRKLKKIKDS